MGGWVVGGSVVGRGSWVVGIYILASSLSAQSKFAIARSRINFSEFLL